MRLRRKGLLLLLGAVFVLGCLTAYLVAARPAAVETLTIKKAAAVRALAVNGRIRPRNSVDVKSPVAGMVLQLPFDVGADVAAGAVIARIDDGPQRAAVAEAAAAIGAQEAVVAQARRNLARFEALGEFVSRRQVEEARLSVEEGARELQRRRASRTEAQEVQQRYVVRAPFGGVILERPVDRGQTVSPETILYRLADLSAPEITAEVDEAYAAQLSPASTALVEVAGRERPLRAKVEHIEPRVDEATGAREVRLRFLQPLGFAPSGEAVSVNLVVERRQQAISIPRSSILQPDSAPRVRIVEADGMVTERPIRFIDWPAADVIVTHGLREGMRILRDPSAASPGDRVRPAA